MVEHKRKTLTDVERRARNASTVSEQAAAADRGETLLEFMSSRWGVDPAEHDTVSALRYALNSAKHG